MGHLNRLRVCKWLCVAALAGLGCSSSDDSTHFLFAGEDIACPNAPLGLCSAELTTGKLDDPHHLDAGNRGVGQTVPSYDIVGVAPANGSLNRSLPAELTLVLGDLPTATTALFYGRRVEENVGKEFTFTILPDTQHYVETQENYKTFVEQAKWILREQSERNIKLVDHLGDIVQNPQNPEEWRRAEAALRLLHQDKFAVGIAPGNHDLSTTSVHNSLYDEYLPTITSKENPIDSYEGRPWYGGYLGDLKDRVTADDLNYENRQWKDNYVLFSAGGMQFINVAIEYEFPGDTEQWLDKVLTAYPERRAIVSTHEFLGADGEFVSNRYRDIWNGVLAKHCNVFLVLSAHVFGESRKQEVRGENNPACPNDPVYFQTSNYQERTAGGNGWLRIMTFHPTEDRLEVQTYSPTLNDGEYETDSDSEFSVFYDMRSEPEAWQLLDGQAAVRGGPVSTLWPDLAQDTSYEWYVQLTDSSGAQEDTEIYRFSTASDAPPIAPSALEATHPSSDRIDLQWVDNAASELEYVILQGDPGDWVEVVRIAADRTSYSLTGVEPNAEYCFEVFADSSKGVRSAGAFSCIKVPAQTE